MGYFPNAAARALKTNRSYNIGILYEDEIHHEFFSLMIDRIRSAAGVKGYDITFLNKSKANSYYDHAKYRCLDGVIILQADFRHPEVIKLINSDLPCVSVDFPYENCSGVQSDNINSLYQLVEYAYAKGHRKIAFVHGQKDGFVTAKRLEGFYSACQARNIYVPDEYVVSSAYHDPQSASDATKKLISLPDPPSCILYPDDYSCLGALSQLENSGLRIPNDICIAGYDGIMLADVLRPKLTTYCQDVQKMGQTAVELLLKSIDSNTEKRIEHIIIPGRLKSGGTL